MRFVSAFLLSGTCFFIGVHCYAQDPCVDNPAPRPGQPRAAWAFIHYLLLQTPPEKLHQFAFGDIETILKCATPDEAAYFFAALRNKQIQMFNVVVAESGQDFVRVSWNDGYNPHLNAFRFTFDRPLDAIPHPGTTVYISGTYSSYSREPFQINMTNASFFTPHPRQ